MNAPSRFRYAQRPSHNAQSRSSVLQTAPAPSAPARSALAIEAHSIDYIPEHERHGRVGQQAPFWFLGNFQFFTIAIGFIGPSLGLSLGFTILAGTLGILFGTLFMAFHASQGPELGLPQMVQSRAQFGYRGVVVPLVGTLFTYAAFNVVDTLLLSSGLNGIFGWGVVPVSVVMTLVALVLAIWGHDWLHIVFRVLFWISLPLVTILTVAIVTGAVTWPAPAPAPPAAGAAPVALGWSLVAFATQLAASASYNITYAPYVSDYTRYLPRGTPTGAIVRSVFLGASAAAIWLIALGAWLATRLNASDALVALHACGEAIYPGFGKVLAFDSVAALVATMGINAYSGMLTVVTGIDSFRPLPRTRPVRVVTTLALAALWLGVALALGSNAIDTLTIALTIMLYLLVPWTAVNLIDFFIVRRGQYAVTELFTPHGIYGAWGVRGLVAYFAGFLAAIPFFVLPGSYNGPVAEWMGGVDLAWLVGLVVSGGVYLLLSAGYRRVREAEAVARSEAQLRALETAIPA